MNTAEMHEVSVATQEGKLTFPQVVGRLLRAEVESYCVDFISGTKTYYTTSGQTHTERMLLKLDSVAEEFSADLLVASIRAAQADSIRYPEFVERSRSAGVLGYWAFLTGRQVIYFGRKGELHIEKFPGTK